MQQFEWEHIGKSQIGRKMAAKWLQIGCKMPKKHEKVGKKKKKI